MDNGRRIDPHIADLGIASGMAETASNIARVPCRNSSKPMRPRYNEQRRILAAAVVKMRADRNHAGQNVERRLDMNESGLCGPWTETGNITSCAHGDGAILVPRNRPVDLRGLIEDNRPHGMGTLAQERRRKPPNYTVRTESFTA